MYTHIHTYIHTYIHIYIYIIIDNIYIYIYTHTHMCVIASIGTRSAHCSHRSGGAKPRGVQARRVSFRRGQAHPRWGSASVASVHQLLRSCDVLWPSAELVCATLYRNGVPNGLPSGRHLLWKCELFAPLGLRTVSAPASSQYGNSCEETWKPLVTVAVAKKRAQQCSLLGCRSVCHATFSSLIVGTAASFETAPRWKHCGNNFQMAQ